MQIFLINLRSVFLVLFLTLSTVLYYRNNTVLICILLYYSMYYYSFSTMVFPSHTLNIL